MRHTSMLPSAMIFLVTVFTTLTACDEGLVIDKAPRQLSYLQIAVAEPAGINCTYGGKKISIGFDDGYAGGIAGNGLLDPNEVRSNAYACDGAPGTAGTHGLTPLAVAVTEPAGDHCTYGGQKISTGFDDGYGGGIADNGKLDPPEVRSNSYACNGTAGSNGVAGSNGLTPLVVAVPEAAGARCANGGQKISSGFDDGFSGGVAGNGLLDAGEVRTSAYVCNGAAGTSGASGTNGLTPLVVAVAEAAGARCTYGGQQIITGFDDGFSGGIAGNGQLDAGEVRTSAYVCNGAAGSNGTAGTNGLTPLVVAVAEVAGANCTNGGQKIITGFDDGHGGGTAGNGQLDAPEVRSTSYVCNGTAGTAGTNGASGTNGLTPLVLAVAEAAGARCAYGGQKIITGFDDGYGGGIAGNGQLDTAEVRSSAYVCNGAPGAGGTGATASTPAFELAWIQGSNSNTRTVTATWTPAAVEQSNFVNQTIGLFSDNLCTTQAASAQILTNFGQSSTPVTFATDGTYFFKVTTTMSGGTLINSACSRFGIKIDTTAPSDATGLAWSQGSSSIRNDVEAQWSRSTSSDLADQDLLLYSGTSCNTLVQTMTSLGSSLVSQVLMTPTGGNYSFKIRSFDSLRNASLSACSSTILISSVEQLTFSGLPTGTSFLTDLSFTVASNNPNFAAYAYAVVSNSSVCPNSGYSAWYPSSTVTTINIAALADGPVRLCAISKDSQGNQMSPTIANSIEWAKSSVASGLGVLPTKRATRLSWNSAGGSIVGYLVIRRTAAAVSWAPENGAAYALSEPDANHTIVFVGNVLNTSKITILDTGLTNNTTYSYRLYGYDISLNYTEIASASGTPFAAGNSCTVLAPPTVSTVCSSDPTNKTASQNFASGDGSQVSPYVICTAAQLSNIRNYLTGKYFVLGDNLDMESFGTWTSIASGFTGNLDGREFHISNLSTSGPGMFTATSANSVLQNFVLKNSTISASGLDKVGAIVGAATGTTLSNLVACNIVSGRNYVGGVVGEASLNSKLLSIINDGQVDGSAAQVGGVVGRVSSSSVAHASNFGIVSGQGASAGGIAGYSTTGSFTNVLNTGAVTTVTQSGGIVGYFESASSVAYAQNHGTITSSSQEAGGIIANSTLCNGCSANFVTKCLNSGRVIATGMYGGGIIGFSHTATATYSTNLGIITGLNYVGGVVGWVYRGTLTNHTNSGAVTSSGDYAGGIIGGSGDDADLNLVNLTNSGSVAGVNRVGGIIGYGSDVGLNTATNSGSVTASGIYVGGIFGLQARYNGVVYHLINLTNSGVIRGLTNVGGLVGWISHGGASITTAENSSSGEVYGIDYVGGIIGRSHDDGDNTLSNTTNRAKITGTGNYVGGIAGYGSDIVLTSADNSGAVTGVYWVGGIIGEARHYNNSPDIVGANNSGPVSGLDYVGGITGTGAYGARFINCRNLASAPISGRDYVAGIAGYMGVDFNPTFSGNQNSALISGQSFVAGIVGRSSDPVLTSNTNVGAVLGTSDYVGGIAALLERYNDSRLHSGNINAGQVSGHDYVGGIVGYHNAYAHSLSSSQNSGNITGNNYVAGIVGTSLTNGDYSLNTLTNSGTISGLDYVAGIIGSGSDIYSSNSWRNIGNITGRSYVAGGMGLHSKYDNNQQTFSAFTNTGKVQGASYTGGVFGALENAFVSTALNTGEIYANRSNINNRYAGGIAGFVSGVRCTICVNSGSVNGNDSVGGITGALTNSIGSTQAWSGLANAGAVQGLSNVGGIHGQVSLANPVTTQQVVNYYTDVSIECTSACGPIVGQHLSGTNTMTSVFSVAQTYPVSNTLGTKVDMALSSFRMNANFLGAPPIGSAFDLMVWDYLLTANGQTQLAWPKAGFP